MVDASRFISNNAPFLNDSVQQARPYVNVEASSATYFAAKEKSFFYVC